MNMHVMQVMDSSGHTTVTWNPDDPASVEDARRRFNELRGRRYTAFRMNTDHEDGSVVESKAERMDEFDPKAGRVMMVPQLQGG